MEEPASKTQTIVLGRMILSGYLHIIFFCKIYATPMLMVEY